MFDLMKGISDVGLVVTKSHEFNNLQIKEADNFINNISVSKYLILNISIDEFNLFIEKELYAEFENQVLKNVFYSLEGDLSWNLYLIIVLNSDDYEKIDKDIIVQFEKNDRFARKMVISENQFWNVIPIGKSVHSDDGRTDINPVNEWIDILTQDGMGFCLDDYSSRKFQNFLSGKNVGADIRKGLTSQREVTTGNHKIDKISIKEKFRSHCYGKNKDIEVGGVNLLYGPNGSGKTSLLEAIELVVTGNVRKKQKDNSADIKEDLDSGISLTMENGLTWDIPDKSLTRKKRESIYYQNRASKHGRDALNSVFHRYNYFSFEDVYMFSFLDEQPEFTEEFSKVIFGEDIRRLERNFGRYQEEFRKSEKQIKARRDEYKTLIDTLTEDIGDNIEYKLDILTLNEVLKELVSEFEECKLNDSLDIIKVWIEKNRDVVNQSIVKMELLSANSEGLDTLHSTKEGIARISEELDQLNNNIELKKHDLNEVSRARDQIISQIADMAEKVSLTEVQLKAMKKMESEFYNKVARLNDFSRCKRIKELKENRNEIVPEIEFGNIVQKKWGYLLDVENENVSSRTALNSELTQFTSNINVIENEIKKLDDEITTQEKYNSDLQVLVSEIRSLGHNYVDKTDNNACPLCNHEYMSRDQLIEAIAATDVNDSTVLVEMYSRKNTLAKKLDEQTANESSIKKSIEIANEITEAYKFITNALDELEEANEKEKLTAIKEFFNEIDKKMESLEKIDNELKLLVNEVYTIERINEAIGFCNEYLSTYSNDLLEENVAKTKNMIDNSIRELNEIYENVWKNISVLTSKKGITETKYEEFNSILKQVESKRDSLIMSENILEKLIEEVSYINQSGVTVMEHDSWRMVFNKLKKSKEIIAEELRKIYQLQSKDKLNSELQDTTNKFEISSRELAICRRAIRVINSLTPSSEYAREFIESNIKGISNLFSTLHFPKEFEGLGLNANGELVGYRGSIQGRKEIPVYLMSTGQRTAVVLSVFFRFFNSLDTVPEFILLDEPVSNVDDLNTLALFDFLRELSLDKDCQVFFTTANTQVAKLFRRKFSFLRDDFNSLRFERNGNSKTTITREYYVEYSDSAIKREVVF